MPLLDRTKHDHRDRDHASQPIKNWFAAGGWNRYRRKGRARGCRAMSDRWSVYVNAPDAGHDLKQKPRVARPSVVWFWLVELISAEIGVLKHRGSNKLIIDGKTFRYVVGHAGVVVGDRVPLALVAQNVEANGSRLRVTGLFSNRLPEEESKSYGSHFVVFGHAT